MRKIFSILFALALVLSFSLVMATPVAAAATLTVDTSLPNTPPNYHTIQAAVDAAGPGDTINVAAGTYNEGVSIPSGKDGLEIAGTNAIVDGTGLGDVNGFSIASDNVKIHGFTIQNFVVSVQGPTTNMLGWGIITEAGTSGGALYDNTITSASGGIYILASTNYEVYSNNINNITGDFPYHGHGIIVYSSGPAQGAISGNIIGKLGHPNTISDTDVATPGYFGCGQGIYVGSDNVLTLLVDAHGTKVEYNIVSNVKSKALQVSGVTTASTVDVNHNQISGSKLWGLDIMYCGVVNVNNNAFSGMTDFQVVRAFYAAANPGNCLTGAEMYDIFKNNGNTFDKAAAAVVPAGNEINTSLANSNYRYIQSDIQDAIADAHSGDTILAGVTTSTGTGMAYSGVNTGNITALAAVATPSGAPVVLPYGMFSFNVTGLTPGGNVTITVELPGAVPIGTKWWKYQAGSWYSLPIGDDDGDNIITVTLTDNAFPDDEDSTAGQITDDGGPGNPGPVGWETYPINKVRVLLPWIALFAAIMAGASLLVLRRRRAQS